MATCLICLKDKKSLIPHLRVHEMTKDQYLERFGKKVDLGTVSTDAPRGKSKKIVTPVDGILSQLDPVEKRQFDEQFEYLYQQAAQDPVLAPMIRDVCMNQVFIARYQLQIERMSSNFSSSMEAKTIVEIHKLIQTMQETNLKQMDSLNLTKSKKDSLNKTPESTPSKIISAFAYVINTMTPQEREKDAKDIEEAMRRLRTNRDSLLTLLDEGEEGLTEDIEPVITE
jgi:hypothetical protein